MEDVLIGLLETFKIPVIRQGSLNPSQPYPDSFFTFWNDDESGQSFYDDDISIVTYSFSVNAYSTAPSTAYNLIDSARTLLRQNGWIITERGYDVPSDEISHIGRGMSVTFLKQFQTNNN